jgi:hypothetical protein
MLYTIGLILKETATRYSFPSLDIPSEFFPSELCTVTKSTIETAAFALLFPMNYDVDMNIVKSCPCTRHKGA